MGKIVKLFLYSCVFTVSIFGSSSFDYYSDGIEDAYIQLTKDIKSGLNERQMGEYKNKFLVAASVDNSSSVDIIFYKTIGGKNSLSPQVVRQGGTNQKFLIFDYLDRKANAVSLQRKLLKYGVHTKIIMGGDGFDFTRDPIIIKELVKDLKNAIKNTPVKVVTIRKIESTKKSKRRAKTKIKAKRKSNKALPSLNDYVHVKSKKKTHKKSKRRSKTNKNIPEQYQKLKNKFCKSGYIQKNSLVVNGKKNLLGSSLYGFTVAKIKQSKEEYIATLLGDNGMYYRLSKNKCSASKKERAIISVNKKQKTKRKTKTKTKNKAVVRSKVKKYTCDFSILKVIKNKNMKNIKISSTTYANKTLKVHASKQDKYYKIRGSGAEAIYLSARYFKKACR